MADKYTVFNPNHSNISFRIGIPFDDYCCYFEISVYELLFTARRPVICYNISI